MFNLDLDFDLPRLRSATESEPQHYQRFRDVDDFEAPQEVDHPHTESVETGRSFVDLFLDNWIAVLSTAAVAAVAAAVLWAHLATYAITFVTNPWVQRVAAAGVLVAAGIRVGWRWRTTRDRRREEAVLFDTAEGKILTYQCRTVHRGEHDSVIELLRGYRWGIIPVPYEAGDLADALTGSLADDDMARLLLEDEWAATAVTDYGVVHVQPFSELQPYHGNRGNLYAAPPTKASEGTVQNLRDGLEDLRRELRRYWQKNATLRENVDEWRALAEANIDDVMDIQERLTEQNTRLLRATGGEPLAEPAVGGLTEAELEAIDREVAPDA